MVERVRTEETGNYSSPNEARRARAAWTWGLYYEVHSAALDLSGLPGFIKSNNCNHAKRSHDGGYQLVKSTQVSPIETGVHSHKRGGVCSI